MLIASLTITALLFPFASYHDDRGDHNQVNPGVVVEADWLAAGIYRNSLDRTTVFVQAAYWTEWRKAALIGPIRFGVSAGLGTGYRYPVIGGLQIQGRYWNVTYVPRTPWEQTGGNTFGFAVRVPID